MEGPEDKGVTFNLISDLKCSIDDNTTDDFHEFLYNKNFVQGCQGQIIITTKPPNPVVKPWLPNGFIDTVYHAYNRHRNLVLRPDDLWMAVTTSLSLYVNAHAEEMRKVFIEHEGKIELTAHGDGDIYTANWNQLIDDIASKIDKVTNGDTRKWLEPNFSTTTKEISTAGKVTMMATFQKYFTYKMYLRCGIPSVTLKGDDKDWKSLRDRVQKLRELKQPDLEHWADLLDFVFAKFEDSYNGNVDAEFWSKICHIQGWGSGPRYCAGWLNVFMPFNEDGKYVLGEADASEGDWSQIDTNNVPPSVVEVPVCVDDNGIVYNTKFIAGFMATTYDKLTNTVAPSIDWAIINLPGEKESNKKMEKDAWEEVWKTFRKGLYFTNIRL